MEIGVLLDEKTFRPRRTVGQGPKENAFVVLDLKSRTLFVRFRLAVSFPSKTAANEPNELYQEYRLKIALVQLTEIHQTADPATGEVSHFTVLDSPPVYHRRISNVADTFIGDNHWRESDSWYRQTYIVHRPSDLVTLPISLKRGNALIDIGEYFFSSFDFYFLSR